jgi:hypothetical protein
LDAWLECRQLPAHSTITRIARLICAWSFT